ncbi:uncharacterized protein [Gossypium hirsutum]|uniref:Uncharacterized protein n=1 Tax=Gossypium hirsutum TaxID=3635 RepID=A0A1U8KWU9_GOSHI|nr:uncharacterized protein LOC107921578 [Gossypium hirsutum]
MKDIFSKEHRLREFEIVALTEGCTTILAYKLPPKLKDPGSFTIPCSIGNHYVGKALCDLGAKWEADQDVSIVPGRPFLPTGRTLIDVQEGELTMRVNDQQVTFNAFNVLKCADANDECQAIGLIETTVEEFTRFCHNIFDSDEDPLEQSDTISFGKFGEFMKATRVDSG